MPTPTAFDVLCGADLIRLKVAAWLDRGGKRNLRATCRQAHGTGVAPGGLLCVRLADQPGGCDAVQDQEGQWWTTTARVVLLDDDASTIAAAWPRLTALWPGLTELSLAFPFEAPADAPFAVRFAKVTAGGDLVSVDCQIRANPTEAMARCIQVASIGAAQLARLTTTFPRLTRLEVRFDRGTPLWPVDIRAGLFPALETLDIDVLPDCAANVIATVPDALRSASELRVETFGRYDARALVCPANFTAVHAGTVLVPEAVAAFGAERVRQIDLVLDYTVTLHGLERLSCLTRLSIYAGGWDKSEAAAYRSAFPYVEELVVDWFNMGIDIALRQRSVDATGALFVACCPALKRLRVPELLELSARALPPGCEVCTHKTALPSASVLRAMADSPNARTVVLIGGEPLTSPLSEHQEACTPALREVLAACAPRTLIVSRDERHVVDEMTAFQLAAVRVLVVLGGNDLSEWVADVTAMAVRMPNVRTLRVHGRGCAAEADAIARVMDAHHHMLRYKETVAGTTLWPVLWTDVL